MSKKFPLLLLAAGLLFPVLSFGQVETQLRVGRRAGWDPRQREGQCQIRVWVDNRAEIRMRGDRIWVNTSEGARGRDEGSECREITYSCVVDVPHGRVQSAEYRYHGGDVRFNERNPLK